MRIRHLPNARQIAQAVRSKSLRRRLLQALARWNRHQAVRIFWAILVACMLPP